MKKVERYYAELMERFRENREVCNALSVLKRDAWAGDREGMEAAYGELRRLSVQGAILYAEELDRMIQRRILQWNTVGVRWAFVALVFAWILQKLLEG